VADALGGQDNLQLLIILPYIISIYNVQIHCEHFRGLQALSQCFLITVNSPTEVGRIFEHFFEVSCQNSPKTTSFSEGIMQKTVLFRPLDLGVLFCVMCHVTDGFIFAPLAVSFSRFQNRRSCQTGPLLAFGLFLVSPIPPKFEFYLFASYLSAMSKS